jgi:hypothetical protein
MIRSVQDEYIRKVVTWVLGRLDRIRPYGMLAGGLKLSQQQIPLYHELIRQGFMPTEEELGIVLQSILIPPAMLEAAKGVALLSDEQLCDFIDHGTFVCAGCGQRESACNRCGFDPDQPLCPKCSGEEIPK